MKEEDIALKTAIKTKLRHLFAMLRNKVVNVDVLRQFFILTIIGKARGNPTIIWKQNQRDITMK